MDIYIEPSEHGVKHKITLSDEMFPSERRLLACSHCDPVMPLRDNIPLRQMQRYRCAVCNRMVWDTGAGWLMRQRDDLDGVKRTQGAFNADASERRAWEGYRRPRDPEKFEGVDDTVWSWWTVEAEERPEPPPPKPWKPREPKPIELFAPTNNLPIPALFS